MLIVIGLMHAIYQKWINCFLNPFSTNIALWIFLLSGTKAHFEILEFSLGWKPCFVQALIHGETVLVRGTAAVVYAQERTERRMHSKCTGNIKWELLLTAKYWGLYYLL